MSGVDIDGQQLRKGAGDAIIDFVQREGGSPPPELQEALDRIGARGRHAAGGLRATTRCSAWSTSRTRSRRA